MTITRGFLIILNVKTKSKSVISPTPYSVLPSSSFPTQRPFVSFRAWSFLWLNTEQSFCYQDFNDSSIRPRNGVWKSLAVIWSLQSRGYVPGCVVCNARHIIKPTGQIEIINRWHAAVERRAEVERLGLRFSSRFEIKPLRPRCRASPRILESVCLDLLAESGVSGF